MKKRPDQESIQVDEIVVRFQFAGRQIVQKAIFPRDATTGLLVLDSFDLLTQRIRSELVDQLRTSPIRGADRR